LGKRLWLKLKSDSSFDADHASKAWNWLGAWKCSGITRNIAWNYDLRKQLEIKSDELSRLKAEERNFITDNLAPLDEIFELRIHLNSPDQGSLVNKYGITWEKIFMIVGPFLTASRNQFEINKKLLDYISEQYSFDQYYMSINSEDSDTIKLQLAAYGFIEIVTTQLKDSQKTVEDLKLSPLGMKILLDLKTHKGGVKAES
jgi:hypothetical protein